MFIPKHFEVTDMNEVRDFIRSNSFGTIITTDQGRPTATHLPLELNEIEGEYYITGHFAKANPQWKTLEEQKEVLIIYQGPHAYISSTWYEDENVSTWNYQSVHVYGTPSILDEDALKEDLKRLMHKYEGHKENGAVWENTSADTKKQINGIVGFKIKVEEVQAAYKLSQNRNEKDYKNVIDKLYEEKDPNAHKVADAMKKLR
ncbi:FMN-binding negative transcriptional regulator [Salinicoccus halodurans]|uniref:Negative transcriptional regulator, PaiB family n=1 Tax=Salinicoccus halodurans TaxID=407035 RepID=A0A0F7HM42_9STAP|nr:FMN-binding negative transcriptional regulator [Salinicoccus halodurans]AKG75177.1 protease [Salinicoccus halodurans]SFK73196.1 negative transcriptional regulator, PaiB family [Salinicoccus halodurans]